MSLTKEKRRFSFNLTGRANSAGMTEMGDRYYLSQEKEPERGSFIIPELSALSYYSEGLAFETNILRRNLLWHRMYFVTQ